MKFSRTILPIILLALMIISLILYAISDSGNERGFKERSYLGVALAQVKSVREITKLNFTETGNEFFIKGRVVDYTFIVDGKLYAGQDIVPANLNFKHVNFKIVARKDIYVKYDKSNPYNNIITRQQKPMHKQYY